MRRLISIGTLLVVVSGVAQGAEIEFVEDFALASDREKALAQLIPGTEEFYYFHALHYLNTERFDEIQPLLQPWIQRHGETQRVFEIRTRHALLTFDRNPAQSLEYLRNRFGIQFPHQKEELNAEPLLPTALDPNLISRKAYTDRANAINLGNLDGFQDSALEWLQRADLNPNHRRSLLARLKLPDNPDLPKLVAADLLHENSGGFGSHPIHRQLLLAQLDELLKLKPDLLTQQNYVVAYLTKLQPGPDEDWRHDSDSFERFLDRMTAFARRLTPSHNSLLAHVLYHRLSHDRRRGVYDKERFLEYLKLPRPVGYASKAVLESDALRRFPCDSQAVYEGATLLGPIGDDEPLVRDYLAKFLLDAPSTREFEPYVNDVYLRTLFAETKIVNGLGQQEQWAALLSPEALKQLKERVDIDFAPTNKTQFGANESVGLDVNVKNVSTLIVKVFEINAAQFYRERLTEIDTNFNLDGLVANVEKTYEYSEPPLRRATRHFDFPTLDKAGVYVIDFIGNGRGSRALIRKGRLHYLSTTSPAGQVFTVLDEARQPVKDAVLWFGGREYPPSADGTILVPFGAAVSQQPLVLTAPIHGSKTDGAVEPATDATYSSLDYFRHEAETYTLAAGFYVDREALLRRKTAEVLIRPALFCNAAASSTRLLEETQLTIQSTDLDGVVTVLRAPDFKLFEDRETTHAFQVPPRLASISFTLSGKVKRLTAGGQKIDVAAAESFAINEIDRTEKTECLHLIESSEGFAVELRGKSGEARPSRPVVFSIEHRDFTAPVGVVLKTNPMGRVALGALSDIASVTATGPDGVTRVWRLASDRHTYPNLVQGLAGEPISFPYLPAQVSSKGKEGAAAGASLEREDASLLELRGETFVADRFENLRLDQGAIVTENLPAGDYELRLKRAAATIRIRLTQGERLDRFVVGPTRRLEAPRLAPTRIESIENDADKVRIQLRGVSEFTRVHLMATRFYPEFDLFGLLGRGWASEPRAYWHYPAESAYLTGRNIGDEYRYIIDRKYARKFPGNMLDRPSLLLNPWAVRPTETGEQMAIGGDEFGAAGAPPASMSEAGDAPQSIAPPGAGNFPNLDFLASGAAIFVNLTPDKDGRVEIDRKALAGHQHLRVLAVDPLNATSRTATLPEAQPKFLDTRLLKPLAADSHFSQRKSIDLVQPGESFRLADITTSKFEAYDSLRRVYGLFATLNRDPKLQEFAFVLDWPNLKPAEKQTLYSKYASHELNFFLFKKDPDYFRSVVLPYLANKKDKTFLDRLLLEKESQEDLLPWNYGRLNVVERILLGRRLADERPRTARHLGDLFALLPPDIDGFVFRFDTAVKAGGLEVDDALGLRKAAEIEVTNGAVMLGAVDKSPAKEKGGALGFDVDAAARPGNSPATKSEELQEEAKAMDMAKKSMPARAGFGARRKRALSEGDAKADDSASDKDQNGREFFDARLADREEIRQLYRKLDSTWEWAENNYHHLTIDQQTADLISVNAFWKDYAEHDPEWPFLSRNLAAATRNFPEMMFALSVLDLPFESPQHETKFQDGAMTLSPKGPIVVFHEQLQPAEPPSGAAKVLVSQNLFRRGDRQRMENGELVDKFVNDEFLVHVVYGCQVVFTNPTSSRQKLTALVQIPEGAIPVLNGQATKTIHLGLEPFGAQTIEYHFYFPAAGSFTHFPVHVDKNGVLIAASAPATLSVVDLPTKIDAESWDYVSQHATNEATLEFLASHNVHAINLERIAWRMRDVAMFRSVTALLAQRHAYHHVLWSYSILHGDVPAAREYLRHADGIVNELGGRLESPILSIDTIARGSYEHLEYKPLVNARAHSLGIRRQILNDRFHFQYHRFLRELAHERRLSRADQLAVVYYMLLQDRVAEALDLFAQIDPKGETLRAQYDYCSAYLDFYTGDLPRARATALTYADYPVERWRNTFATIRAQLDEAEGMDPGAIDTEDRERQQAQLAASEPSFDFKIESKKIEIQHRNLKKARVNFYEMDVELLFSRDPFAREVRGQFGAIRPNRTLTVDLAGPTGMTAVALPAELGAKNFLVEVVAGGTSKSQAYYSHSLAIHVIENYGQVKVTSQSDGKPIAKAYVKVYAQTADGQAKFYKDGYTDVRGRFDYASLSTNDLEGATKFSLLILSDDHGALTREANPPQR